MLLNLVKNPRVDPFLLSAANSVNSPSQLSRLGDNLWFVMFILLFWGFRLIRYIKFEAVWCFVLGSELTTPPRLMWWCGWVIIVVVFGYLVSGLIREVLELGWYRSVTRLELRQSLFIISCVCLFILVLVRFQLLFFGMENLTIIINTD